MANGLEKSNPEGEPSQEERELFKSREEEVKERGPIFYEEKEGKRFVNICGIEIETFTSENEIEEIKKELVETSEFITLLRDIATHYRQKEPLIIEGPTATGKTLAVNTFTRLIYGKEEKPLDFYCKGQTDETQLMAKWVPRSEDPEDEKKWNKFLESEAGSKNLKDIYEEAKEKELPEKEGRNYIINKIKGLAQSIGVSESAQFKLQYGLIPRGMTMEKERGYIVHIQEPSLAEPHVLDTLLVLGGERGKLPKSIQLWEDGGRTIKAGENFWVVFSTNPPEEYPARNEVDPALARRLVWKRIGELSERSLSQMGDFAFTYQEARPKLSEAEGKELYHIPTETPIDLREHPEISKILAEPVIDFHKAFTKSLKEGLEKERRQKVPLTCDEFFRVADLLDRFQTKDLFNDLKRAVEIYYLERLASEDAKEKMRGLFETTTNALNTEEKLQKAIEEIDPEIKQQREDEELQRLKKEILDHSEISPKVKKLVKKAKSVEDFWEAVKLLESSFRK